MSICTAEPLFSQPAQQNNTTAVPARTVSDLALLIATGVTFKDFQTLMVRRNHSVEDLVGIFRGKIDDPREFFERVMRCQWRNPKIGRYEDRGQVVIPYRSVIEFYHQQLGFFKDVHAKYRACACGCGNPVFDRKKWATAYCRQKMRRQKVTDGQLSES